LCGIYAHVRCSCGHSGGAEEFIAHGNRCPACGSIVRVPGGTAGLPGFGDAGFMRGEELPVPRQPKHFDQNPGHPMECGRCLATSLEVERRSVAEAAAWLAGVALGLREGGERPGPLSVAVLRPQCREMLCEAPVRRDAAAESEVLPRIGHLFERSLLAAPETRVILTQSALNWAMNQAPIGTDGAILVGRAGLCAALVANNAVADSREAPACHHTQPVESVSAHLLAEVRAAYGPRREEGCEPLQSGDVIALHLLQRGLRAAGFHGADHPLHASLAACDLIEHASSVFFECERAHDAPCRDSPGVSSALRRVAASPGASLVVDRIVRDMGVAVCAELSTYDPVTDVARLPLRELPYSGRLAEICSDLLEEDASGFGAWIASQVMAELQALFEQDSARLCDRSKPDDEVAYGAKVARLAVERNPVWELLGYADGRGSMPRFLALMTARVADLRFEQSRWTGKQGIAVQRYRRAALSWIGREQMASPFWHLFLVRFTGEMLSLPGGRRRCPPGCDFTVADLCRRVEEVRRIYEKAQAHELGRLVQAEAAALLGHPEFLHTSAFLAADAGRESEWGSRAKEAGSANILDYFLEAQIEKGIFPPDGRDAQPLENGGWTPSFPQRGAPGAEGLEHRAQEASPMPSAVVLAETAAPKPPVPKARTGVRRQRRKRT